MDLIDCLCPVIREIGGINDFYLFICVSDTSAGHNAIDTAHCDI